MLASLLAVAPSPIGFCLLLLLAGGAASHSHNHSHSHTLQHRAVQQASNGFVRCGTDDLTAEERDDAAARLGDYVAVFGLPERQAASMIAVVDTVWHNIKASDGSGGMTEQMITDSMRILNDAFATSGFVFHLIDTIVTNNNGYYTSGRDAGAMKDALRQGTATTLNIYSTDLLRSSGGILGFATFPSSYARNPGRDGIVIDGETAPGGSASPYNLGDTLVHEVGHWLGLFHVFSDQGTCAPGSDQVDDTPDQSTPTFGCPDPRDDPKDSCVNRPGVDATTNFMDYTDDRCMYEFTAGQTTRMALQWEAFRMNASPAGPESLLNLPCGLFDIFCWSRFLFDLLFGWLPFFQRSSK